MTASTVPNECSAFYSMTQSKLLHGVDYVPACLLDRVLKDLPQSCQL